MPFHIYDLGPVSALLQQYADTQGFIPLPGDVWQNFQWTHKQKKTFGNKITGEQNWQYFQTKVFLTILKAERALLDLEFAIR